MFLWNDVKKRMADGTCPPCLTSETIADLEKMGVTELDAAYTVSSPFGAGIETTSGTLFIFILAMLHFPDAMRKAQEEIDAVIGHERMPEFDDRESLPYVQALINETLRWRPVAALGGSPHAVTADDVYNGMFIPKGSSVFANLDGIMRDSEMFPNPHSFLPERFITTTNPRLQTFDLPFGWGRRVCPGMHLASNSLFINIARILWGYDVLPVKDAQGKDVLPDVWKFTNGFNSWPESFKCQFKVRDEKVRDCVERECEAAKESLGKWQ